MGVAPPGFVLEVRRGDATDPLVGVVRLEEDLRDEADPDQVPEQIDVVVLTGPWARRAVSGSGPTARLGEVAVPVVDMVNLVLLKLYAGSRRDAWDVGALLEVADDPESLIASVQQGLDVLPERCRRLWANVRGADV